jgi:hypothetical protein
MLISVGDLIEETSAVELETAVGDSFEETLAVGLLTLSV